MTMPVCLQGHMHICPIVEPGPKPHCGGPITEPGQDFVRFNGVPLAVEGGKCTCTGMPGDDPLAKGSSTVRINGRGVIRMSDPTAHGGCMVAGQPNLRSD